MTINRSNAIEVAKELGIKVDAVTPIFEKAGAGATLRERLENALRSLPLHGAFTDAIVTLRKIMKEDGDKKDECLKMIYKLAVWESFCPNPYSKVAKCPSFNILLLAFDKVKRLSFDWPSFGYKKLNLSASDIKSMVAAWGEPKRHRTLCQAYKQIYSEYELKAKDAVII